MTNIRIRFCQLFITYAQKCRRTWNYVNHFSVRNRQTFHLCGHWFFSENVAAFFAWRSFPAAKYNYVNHLAKSLCRPQCRYGRQVRFLSKSDWQDVQILLQWVVSIGMMPRVFPKQDATAAAPCAPAKAIRTAGSNAENHQPWWLATSVALLIELKAQFYKLVTL